MFSMVLNTQQATCASTLADTIQFTLDNVRNWQKDLTTVHFSQVFRRGVTASYDDLVRSYAFGSDPTFYDELKTACFLKRVAELDGYRSTVIDDRVKEALGLFTFNDHLPYTFYNAPPYGDGSTWTLMYDRYIVHAYDWAQSWGIRTDKWNKQSAYNEVLSVVNRPSGSFPQGGAPRLGYAGDQNGWSTVCRYYDESAETLDFLFKLAGSDGGIWDYINGDKGFWTGTYYSYHRIPDKTFECEAGAFALLIGYYYAKRGHQLSNFDRVKLDLETKFLSNGWNSPLWGTPGVCVHASSNDQLRLWNTLNAIAALHAYYKVSTWKNSFVNLLQNQPKAWEAIINSPMYHDGRFSGLDGSAGTDPETALGAFLLFLEGIIPDTGSLAIPLNEECYQDFLTNSPATLFGFDYASRKIKIPVWNGRLKFQFGSSIATADFSSDGIYEVTFGSDWNTVQAVNRIGDLGSSGFEFITEPGSGPQPSPSPSPSPPPTQDGRLTVTGTYNSLPASFEGWYSFQARESSHVNVPTSGYSWLNLAYGTYTVYGRIGSVSASQVAYVSSSQPVSVRLDFFGGQPSKGSILVRGYADGEPVECKARYQVVASGQMSDWVTVPNSGYLWSNLELGAYIVSGQLDNQEVNVSIVLGTGLKEARLEFQGGENLFDWLCRYFEEAVRQVDMRVVFVVGVAAFGVGLWKASKHVKRKR